MQSNNKPTSAAVILIGNEILSGKTQDANLQYLGNELAALGVVLQEARVIRDDHETIVDGVKAMSAIHDYVFTTGGIGPTHDDITAAAVAAAFDVPLELDATAAELIGGERDHPRMKMALIPSGAELIENPLSRAPGFRIANVYVLAGVPSIAKAMFEGIKPTLSGGVAIISSSVDVFMKESDIAAPLAKIAAASAEVEIGSYPFVRDGRYGANLVVRGTDAVRVDEIVSDIAAVMSELGAEVLRKN